MCLCVKAVDFLSQVLDSPEPETVRNAVESLQDIGEGQNSDLCLYGFCFVHIQCGM